MVDVVAWRQLLDDASLRWSRHVEILDGAYAARDLAPADADAAWLPRDEYADLWRSLDRALAATRAGLEGGDTAATGQADDRALSYEEARARAHAAHERYLGYLGALRDEHRDDADVLRRARAALVDDLDERLARIVEGSLRSESETWERLTAALDARPGGVLHTGDGGIAWRASDVYAHLARWMEVNHGRVEAYFAGGVVPDLDADVDSLNATWSREDATLAFAAARRRAFLARDRFIGQLRGIDPERLTARLIGIYAANAWGHYQEHLGYLGGEGARQT